jgi:Leucine-rich repeat (LRR) protein
MASLSRIDVTSNEIELLPPEIGEIEALKKIDLSLNPVIDEIDAVARQGAPALIKYLRSTEYRNLYAKKSKK